MRKVLAFVFLFSITFFPALAANNSNSPLVLPIKEKYSSKTSPKKMALLKVRDLERLAGRKLTIKEKIGFLILKKKTRNQEAAPKSKGKTALIFGIAGIALFIIGIFAPFVIIGSLIAAIVAVVLGSSAAKKDPKDRKAHSAKLLGWITLGLIALLMVLVVVYVAAFTI
jgi:hypothetical protein